MSLSIATLPTISPVYTDNLILNAKESTATSNFTYIIRLYINSILQDTFNYTARPVTVDANIDLGTLLRTYFESQVYLPTGTTNSTSIFEIVPDSIVPYLVNICVYNASNVFVASGDTATNYIFNGCFNAEDSFVINDFIMSGATSGNFLTNFHTNREITIGDKAYVSVIGGDYSPLTSNFSGVTITRYQDDGSTSSITHTYSSTAKGIINIDVSPSRLNLFNTNFINTNTLYYTIDERQGFNKESMKISVVQESRFTKYYNFIYVNHLGGQDFYTAVKVPATNYKIEKSLLDHFYHNKIYNTNVERENSIMTQYLSVYQGEKLRELFYSPAVKLYLNSIMNDVRITNSELVVQDKYPKENLISYIITFIYNNRFYTQLF